MSKIKWYFKQLLPLKFESKYIENGAQKLTLWKMWFGKCYNIRTYNIADN